MIIIDNAVRVRIASLQPHHVAMLRKHHEYSYTIRTPDRYGRLVAVSKSVRAWSTDGAVDSYPIGVASMETWPHFARGIKIEDRRTAVQAPLLPGPNLRPYQEEALNAIRNRHTGVVEIACGGGKTRVGVAAACTLGLRTCVLVHTQEIAAQWLAQLKAEGCEVGLYGAGRRDSSSGHMVAMVQTLAADASRDHQFLGRFFSGFGVTILDEAHHAPADSFSAVVAESPTRYRIALTATPTRKDKREREMYWTFGPTIFEYSAKKLIEGGYTMQPEYRAIESHMPVIWADDENNSWQAAIKDLHEDDERADMIVRAAADLVREGHQVAVLTERIDYACRISASLCAIGIKSASVSGKTKPKDRAAIDERLRSGELRVVCATKLLDEGYDVPTLSAVVLADPSNNAEKAIQRVGRAMRMHAGKRRPVVLQVVDTGARPLKQCAQRIARALHSQLGCTRAAP